MESRTFSFTCAHPHFSSPVVQCSEGTGGELAGVRWAAAYGGAEPGRAGGGHRHEAAWGWAPRPGAGPGSRERTQPAEEEEQRTGGSCADARQSPLFAGINLKPNLRSWWRLRQWPLKCTKAVNNEISAMEMEIWLGNTAIRMPASKCWDYDSLFIFPLQRLPEQTCLICI